MLWRSISMSKSKFNIFQFKFGKQKKSLTEWIKIGAILHLSLDTLSLIPGLEKRKLFNALDVVQSKLGIEVLNDYIIQDDELISYRIHRVVDEAIKDYEKNK